MKFKNRNIIFDYIKEFNANLGEENDNMTLMITKLDTDTADDNE